MTYLRTTPNPENLYEFYQEQGLNTESEALLIYLQGALDLDSGIAIFEIEETEDDLVFKKEGLQYFQLFPVDYAVELLCFTLNTFYYYE